MGISTLAQTVEQARRPVPRTRTIGVRVTEPEYLALEGEAWKAGKTIADWARDQILGPAAARRGENLHEHVFTELVGVELLLMNALGPLLRGERLTQEQLEAVWKQAQTSKGRKAQELLVKRAHHNEGKQP
jgi:hypothetical protein